MKKLAMTIDEIHDFVATDFPQVMDQFRVVALEPGFVRVKMLVGVDAVRPGGTVSGPAMFALADVAMYFLVLASVGPKALAVTTNCSIDFMRKPEVEDMIAEVRMLKLGRRLAVGNVLLFSERLDEPVARAGITYSIPN